MFFVVVIVVVFFYSYMLIGVDVGLSRVLDRGLVVGLGLWVGLGLSEGVDTGGVTNKSSNCSLDMFW